MNEAHVTLRIPQDLLDRAEVLAPVLKDRPGELSLLRVSRAAVLRLAILRGIEVLEKEYGVKPPKRGAK